MPSPKGRLLVNQFVFEVLISNGLFRLSKVASLFLSLKHLTKLLFDKLTSFLPQSYILHLLSYFDTAKIIRTFLLCKQSNKNFHIISYFPIFHHYTTMSVLLFYLILPSSYLFFRYLLLQSYCNDSSVFYHLA